MGEQTAMEPGTGHNRLLESPVLVGYQASAAGRRAVEWAVSEARAESTPLRVIRAWRWDSDFDPVSPLASKREIADYARATLPAAARDFTSLVAVPVDGEPAAELEDAAVGARMIVVGRRQLPLNERLFNGSVSRHLVAAADVPVVVVPETKRPFPRRGPIVVGVTESPASLAAVAWAARRAARDDLPLVLLNAHHVPPAFRPIGGAHTASKPDHAVAESATLLQRAAAVASDVGGSGVSIQQEPVSGSADSALLQRCEQASIVVLGKHRRSWPGHRVGSVADQLLHHAEVPIAVVPTVRSEGRPGPR